MIFCHSLSVATREDIVLLSLLGSLRELLVHLSVNCLTSQLANSSEHCLNFMQQPSFIELTVEAWRHQALETSSGILVARSD